MCHRHYLLIYAVPGHAQYISMPPDGSCIVHSPTLPSPSLRPRHTCAALPPQCASAATTPHPKPGPGNHPSHVRLHLLVAASLSTTGFSVCLHPILCSWQAALAPAHCRCCPAPPPPHNFQHISPRIPRTHLLAGTNKHMKQKAAKNSPLLALASTAWLAETLKVRMWAFLTITMSNRILCAKHSFQPHGFC
jgi:hypothetical protein